MSIDVKNLHIEYKGQLVFNQLDLKVHDHEIVAIRTEVLDGATSLLKGMAGLLNGVGGEAIFEGVNLLQTHSDAIRHRIGYVYEDGGLVSIYSVFQNISLPLQFHTEMDYTEITNLVKDICTELHIPASQLEQMPHMLNDVQTRMVNLARALVVNPGVLFIDELEGGMSDVYLRDTMTLLKQRQARHPMAIIITTASDIVMELADRAFIINDYGLEPISGNP